MTIDVERIAREAGAKFELVGEAGLNRLCNAILEEAAKACEARYDMKRREEMQDMTLHYAYEARRCADRVRALKVNC